MSREGWNTFKIGDIGKIITGKTPSTQNLDNFGEKYPFITPRDMGGQKKVNKTERYLSEEGKNSVKNCLLPANSICVSCIGSDMGKVVMTTTDSVTNQQLNSIICHRYFDPDFVYYALVNIAEEFRNAGRHSTAVPILNKSDFSSFEITAPNIATQRRISAILSALDDKIELNRQTNATLEAISQTIFKEWFEDYRFPGVTDEVEDSELGSIPKGWKIQRLGDVCDRITKGTTPTTFGDKFKGEGILFLRAECIQEDVGIDVSKALFISSETHSKLKRSQLSQNDILITIAGVIGRTGIVTERILPANINQAIAIVRTDPSLLPPTYAFFYLRQKTTRDELLSGITQSVQANISLTDLSKFRIIIPARRLLDQFGEVVGGIRKKIENQTQQLCILVKTRDSLLQKMMNGEINI
jgi:type I restriction enzyme, S subunit